MIINSTIIMSKPESIVTMKKSKMKVSFIWPTWFHVFRCTTLLLYRNFVQETNLDLAKNYLLTRIYLNQPICDVPLTLHFAQRALLPYSALLRYNLNLNLRDFRRVSNLF